VRQSKDDHRIVQPEVSELMLPDIFIKEPYPISSRKCCGARNKKRTGISQKKILITNFNAEIALTRDENLPVSASGSGRDRGFPTNSDGVTNYSDFRTTYQTVVHFRCRDIDACTKLAHLFETPQKRQTQEIWHHVPER
jgi:hypothetical protein